MKIFAYNVEPYEMEAFTKWMDETGIEVKLYNGLLTPETVEMTEGYDAVTTCQVPPMKDEEIYKKLNEYGIKHIASRTAGVDMFDLELARKYDVTITNVPRYSPHAIAEMAVTHAMVLLRNIKAIEKKQELGNFKWEKPVLSKEMRSCTVGIVGTGFIGSTAAKLFKGLGAEVIGYDLVKNPEAEEVLTYTDSLEELLGKSDIVSLHLPLVDATYHLINADNIKLMKPGSIIINTGRGALIDIEALIPHLESGFLKGAGMDVLECEAIYVNQNVDLDKIKGTPVEKLMNMENVRMTGHYAFFTETAVDNLVSTSLGNIKTHLETGEAPNCKN